MSTYEGWTNYPTWNINLWINNDEGSQEYWEEQAKAARRHGAMATYELANQLKDEMQEMAADTVETGMMSDLLTWAIAQVNFREIAEGLLEAVEEEEEEEEEA